MFIRFRGLAVSSALVVASLVALAPAALAQDKKPAQKIDKATQLEIDAAAKLVDDVVAGEPAPNDLSFTWQNHSLKAQGGKTFVPFTLTFNTDKAPPPAAVYYLRVISKAVVGEAAKVVAAKAAADRATRLSELEPENAELAELAEKARAAIPKVEYAYEDFLTITLKLVDAKQTFRFQRMFVVPAGDYDIYVVIKEPAASAKGKKAPLRATVSKIALAVPNYWTSELATSAVIVASKAEQLPAPLPPAQLASNPYVFGSTRLTPSPDGRFSTRDELSVYFLIYNNGLDKTTNKPDMIVDYNFYQKSAGAEKYFNKTEPQTFNAQTLQQFDASAAQVLTGGVSVPLTSFPAGDYRLEIKLVDKVTGKTKTENVPFTVIAG